VSVARPATGKGLHTKRATFQRPSGFFFPDAPLPPPSRHSALCFPLLGEFLFTVKKATQPECFPIALAFVVFALSMKNFSFFPSFSSLFPAFGVFYAMIIATSPCCTLPLVELDRRIIFHESLPVLLAARTPFFFLPVDHPPHSGLSSRFFYFLHGISRRGPACRQARENAGFLPLQKSTPFPPIFSPFWR